MSWLLFLFYLLVWGGLIVACFPNLWPSFIHERIDGHIKLKSEAVQAVAVVRRERPPVLLTGPLSVRLVAAYNNASFMQRVTVGNPEGVYLRYSLKGDGQVMVAQATSEDDIYIFRFKRGKRVACYWAREPELYAFLARQMWRKAAVSRKDRQERLRSTHLKLVR